MRYQEARQIPAPDRSARWEAYQALPPERTAAVAGARRGVRLDGLARDAAGAQASAPRERQARPRSNIVPNPAPGAAAAAGGADDGPGLARRHDDARSPARRRRRRISRPACRRSPRRRSSSTARRCCRDAGRRRQRVAPPAQRAPGRRRSRRRRRPVAPAATPARAASMTTDGRRAAPARRRRATPALARRMACFVYEAMLLFGIGAHPRGASVPIFVAQTGQQHPLQSETRPAVVRLRALRHLLRLVLVGARPDAGDADLAHPGRDGRGRPLSQARALAALPRVLRVWFAPATLVAAFLHCAPWPTLGLVGAGIVVYALLALAASAAAVLARPRCAAPAWSIARARVDRGQPLRPRLR